MLGAKSSAAACELWEEYAVASACHMMGKDDHAAAYPGPPFQPRAALVPVQMPYMIELWNEQKSAVQTTLAAASSGSIGYAAFYAAAKEYPDRYITLRCNDAILSQFNVPGD
jgi:hypothetical protein